MAIGDDHSADMAALEIGPHKFVGIQFGRVSGQEEQLQSTIERLDEMASLLRSMGRMTVDDEKDRMLGVVHEAAEEFAEPLRVDGPLDHHEPQFPLGADRRKHVQAEALPS